MLVVKLLLSEAPEFSFNLILHLNQRVGVDVVWIWKSGRVRDGKECLALLKVVQLGSSSRNDEKMTFQLSPKIVSVSVLNRNLRRTKV